MSSPYGWQRLGYQTGRQANFIKVRTSPPSKEARKPPAIFKIKVLMGSITIVVGSFLITLSVLHLYDFLITLSVLHLYDFLNTGVTH
jgi:hypothetical protein